jgi:hypothetical protein
MKSITNDEMVLDLVSFYNAYDQDNKVFADYKDFYTRWRGVLQMAEHQHTFAWVAITEAGYQVISEAHSDLLELGWLDDSDIDNANDYEPDEE